MSGFSVAKANQNDSDWTKEFNGFAEQPGPFDAFITPIIIASCIVAVSLLVIFLLRKVKAYKTENGQFPLPGETADTFLDE